MSTAILFQFPLSFVENISINSQDGLVSAFSIIMELYTRKKICEPKNDE